MCFTSKGFVECACALCFRKTANVATPAHAAAVVMRARGIQVLASQWKLDMRSLVHMHSAAHARFRRFLQYDMLLHMEQELRETAG
jgi:hypothetical protein